MPALSLPPSLPASVMDVRPVPAITRTMENASSSVVLLATYGADDHWRDDAPLQLVPRQRLKASIRTVRRLEFAPLGDELVDDETE